MVQTRRMNTLVQLLLSTKSQSVQSLFRRNLFHGLHLPLSLITLSINNFFHWQVINHSSLWKGMREGGELSLYIYNVWLLYVVGVEEGENVYRMTLINCLIWQTNSQTRPSTFHRIMRHKDKEEGSDGCWQRKHANPDASVGFFCGGRVIWNVAL